MSDAEFSFRQKMLISHTHPSLDGHFPDNPIVPGVVILDQVISLWQKKANKQIVAINNTKFVQLLRADIACTIYYNDCSLKNNQHNKKLTRKIEFLIKTHEQKIIAKGVFSYGE